MLGVFLIKFLRKYKLLQIKVAQWFIF